MGVTQSHLCGCYTYSEFLSHLRNPKLRKLKSFKRDCKETCLTFAPGGDIIFIFIFKYTLLIILLQLSQFFSLCSLSLVPPFPPAIPHLSSCPWVVCISSLASPFPILFLPSPCLFCTYQLCFLIPIPLSPFSLSASTPQLITLHVISISMILFLF